MLATHFALPANRTSTSPIHKVRSYVFGTLAEVTICSPDDRRARHLATTILEDFDRLHRMLHAWEKSDLVALNGAIATGCRNIAVKPELAQLIRNATEFSERSRRLFNPAIGKLVGLWNFHASEFLPVTPDAGEIGRLLNAGLKMTDLAVEGNAVNCANRDVQLDFGGYAKGYALDRAIAFLRRREVTGALINIGGNLMALGTKCGQPWRISIQHPRKPEPLALLSLHDGEAISTSGDYERYFTRDGKRYCHVIDPRTGWPACETQCATVLMTPGFDAGSLSDASSGALFIQGRKGWHELAERIGISNLLLIDQRGEIHLTDRMHDRLEFL